MLLVYTNIQLFQTLPNITFRSSFFRHLPNRNPVNYTLQSYVGTFGLNYYQRLQDELTPHLAYGQKVGTGR